MINLSSKYKVGEMITTYVSFGRAMLADDEECLYGKLRDVVDRASRRKTLKVAQVINNDPKLLAAFYHHAKLKL